MPSVCAPGHVLLGARRAGCLGSPRGPPPTLGVGVGSGASWGREVLRVTSRRWRRLRGARAGRRDPPLTHCRVRLLEAAVIQVCMPVLPAGGSANVYVQHELQAFSLSEGTEGGPGTLGPGHGERGVSWGPPPSLQALAQVPVRQWGGKDPDPPVWAPRALTQLSPAQRPPSMIQTAPCSVSCQRQKREHSHLPTCAQGYWVSVCQHAGCVGQPASSDQWM